MIDQPYCQIDHIADSRLIRATLGSDQFDIGMPAYQSNT